MHWRPGSFPVQTVVWNTSGLLGEKTIYVKVDASGAVAEADENNNVTSAAATVKMKPDLVAVSLSLPDLRVGENVSASAVIKNQGQADVTGAVVKLYNGTPETGTLLGSTTLDVAEGASVTAQIPFTLSGAGQPTLWVKVDPADVIVEADESNNASSATAHVGWNLLTVDAGASSDLAFSCGQRIRLADARYGCEYLRIRDRKDLPPGGQRRESGLSF